MIRIESFDVLQAGLRALRPLGDVLEIMRDLSAEYIADGVAHTGG